MKLFERISFWFAKRHAVKQQNIILQEIKVKQTQLSFKTMKICKNLDRMMTVTHWDEAVSKPYIEGLEYHNARLREEFEKIKQDIADLFKELDTVLEPIWDKERNEKEHSQV